MKCGVVYKFQPHNKLNGTLFYCFEYFSFLRKFTDVDFYIVDINDSDIQLIKSVFSAKYNASTDNIKSIKLIDLYKLQLDKTLILDIKTFYSCKEFLTNEIHCFSNDTHDMFRYKNDRIVTYYGSYEYQRYDVFCYLKLNFDIFKPIAESAEGVFISSPDQAYISDRLEEYQQQFNKPVILKKYNTGTGQLFELIDSVHYVHTSRDTNNRIIPESFFYNKQVTVEHLCPDVDSIVLRYDDIITNGLGNYTLSEDDEMIKACLK